MNDYQRTGYEDLSKEDLINALHTLEKKLFDFQNCKNDNVKHDVPVQNVTIKSVDIGEEEIYKIIYIISSNETIRKKFIQALQHKVPNKLNFKIGDTCAFCGSKNVYARGLCKNCYSRARLNFGDPTYKEKQIPKSVFNYSMSWQEKYVNYYLKNRGCIQFVKPIDFNETVELFVSQLPERDKKIVYLYFIHGKTLNEISEAFKLTKERIRQIIIRTYTRGNVNRLFLGDKELTHIKERQIAEIEEDNFHKALERRAQAENAINNIDKTMTIKELLLYNEASVRSYNCIMRFSSDKLKKYNPTVSELLNDYYGSDYDNLESYFMYQIRNCGKKTARELENIFSSKLS